MTLPLRQNSYTSHNRHILVSPLMFKLFIKQDTIESVHFVVITKFSVLEESEDARTNKDLNLLNIELSEVMDNIQIVKLIEQDNRFRSTIKRLKV